MIITLKEKINDETITGLINQIKSETNSNEVYYHDKYHVIVCDEYDIKELNNLKGIDNIINITTPYQLISREFKKEDTKIKIGDYTLFDNSPELIAGPCSVESTAQMELIAATLVENKIKVIRGGIVKPRTSPYTFQGLNTLALDILKQIKAKYNLLICSEIMSVEQLNTFKDDIDIIQIGTRNMQNIELLKAAGQVNKPILLKRGFGNTIEEFLLAAEYIVLNGNPDVILCERGIRTFETAYRNVLDINAIPYLKKMTHLPIISDPSHACGQAWMVPSLSLASVSAGADGLIIEVHNQPELALSDGKQALNLSEFTKLNKQLLSLAKCL